MCWQSHGRISYSPDTWRWSLCTPRGSTCTVWDNRNYLRLTQMGGRWNLKASVQRKKQNQTKPNIKRRSFHFLSSLVPAPPATHLAAAVPRSRAAPPHHPAVPCDPGPLGAAARPGVRQALSSPGSAPPSSALPRPPQGGPKNKN